MPVLPTDWSLFNMSKSETFLSVPEIPRKLSLMQQNYWINWQTTINTHAWKIKSVPAHFEGCSAYDIERKWTLRSLRTRQIHIPETHQNCNFSQTFPVEIPSLRRFVMQSVSLGETTSIGRCIHVSLCAKTNAYCDFWLIAENILDPFLNQYSMIFWLVYAFKTVPYPARAAFVSTTEPSKPPRKLVESVFFKSRKKQLLSLWDLRCQKWLKRWLFMDSAFFPCPNTVFPSFSCLGIQNAWKVTFRIYREKSWIYEKPSLQPLLAP